MGGSFGPKIKCMRTRPYDKWGQAELEASSSKEDSNPPSPRPGLETSTAQQTLACSHYDRIGSKYFPLQHHAPHSHAVLSSLLVHVFPLS